MGQSWLSVVEERISGNRDSRIVDLSQIAVHRGSDRIAYRRREEQEKKKNRERDAIPQSPNQPLFQGRNNERILDLPEVSEGLGRSDTILQSASPSHFRFCAGDTRNSEGNSFKLCVMTSDLRMIHAQLRLSFSSSSKVTLRKHRLNEQGLLRFIPDSSETVTFQLPLKHIAKRFSNDKSK
jgi:hypothetical protein